MDSSSPVLQSRGTSSLIASVRIPFSISRSFNYIFFQILLSRMAEPNRSSLSASAAASSSSSYREDSGAAASSSGSSSQIREEVGEQDHDYQHQRHFHNPEPERQHIGGLVTYRGNVSALNDSSMAIRNETWSCIIVVFTFWFFISMTLILGVYGAVNIRLGPNCSLLIQPNPIFVKSVKLEELDDAKPGLKVYGFYKSPSLDVLTTWSETHTATVQADSHKEWIHYLNRGSQVNISYNVNSAGSSVFLVIAQGSESLSQWLEDPTYPNITLSWNIVHGSGMIMQDIYRSSSYYIALGNLNSEDVEVELNLTIMAFIYNTTEAYYRCAFSNNGHCSLSILFPQGNSVVLTSPGPEQNTSADDWSVRLSYGPRWITYIFGIGGMTAAMLGAFYILNKCQFSFENETNVSYGNIASTRAPLLSRKDDDILSWGSSYDSVSSDEADLEDFVVSSVEGTSMREGGNDNNTRRLCAICFDAPRDCFFLPCGHCVACYACGTRIAEAAGTCPICRRNIKKVRKIFSV